MKVSKKLFIMVVLFVAGFVLMACGETTTEVTTAAPTTEAPTTVEDTTVAPTTEAPTTEAPTTEAPTTEAPTTEAPVDLEALIDDLETHYADTLGNDSFVATDDITLLATIGGVEITWTTSNAGLITADGTVTQPSYTVGNQNAILTATLTDGEDSESTMFFVAVQALAKTDQERADEAFDTVAIFPDKDSWTIVDEELLVFATTAQDEDEAEYTVVWTSSHPAIIPATGGEINQPEGANVDVTMTATISINSVDYTTTVVFTVAKQAEGELVTDLASILLLVDDEGDPAYDDAYVKIPGMTCIGISDDGVYFTDGVNIIFTYSPKFEVEMGSVYDVTGTFEAFYGLYQLTGSDELPLKAFASTEAVVATPITDTLTVAEMFALPSPSDTNPEFAKMYTVTGAIYYDTEMDYATYMVPSDYDFGVARTGDKPNGTGFVEMYYRGDDEVLWAFNEQVITIDLLYGGYHDGHSNIHARFHGDITDVTMTFDTDQEAVDQALAALLLPGEIIEATTLDLLDEVFGVTLSYASNNEAIINSTTGVVDLTGLTTRVTVTITVTGTKGDTATGTREIEIKVGELPVSTIAAAVALDDGVTVKVRGVVISSENYNTFMIQDDTGAIAIYNYSLPSDIKDFLNANVGNLVEVVGDRDTRSSGLIYLDPETATFVEVSSIPDATNIDAVAEEDFIDYQNMLVEFTNLYVVETYTNSFGTVEVTLMRLTDGAEFLLRWDSRIDLSTEVEAALKALVAGDRVDVVAGLGWYNGAQLLYAEESILTVGTAYTDADLLAADAAFFPTDITLSSNYELPELLFSTATVTIPTELTAYLTDDIATNGQLVVTFPSDVDKIGVVTFTLSLNDTDLDVTVNVTVEAFTNADKLALDVAELETGAAEYTTGTEYQVIELPDLMTLGSSVTWTKVSGDATLDGYILKLEPTGTSYDVVLEATISLGSETDVVRQFTMTVSPITVVTDLSTLTANTGGVWTIADDTEVYVKGIVVGFGYHVVYIQDANGNGLYLYYGEGYDNDGTVEIGDEVIYFGSLDTDEGSEDTDPSVRRLGYGGEIYSIWSTGNSVVDFTLTLDEVTALGIEDSGKQISVTGLVYTGENYGKYQFNVIGTTTVGLEVHPDSAPDWFLDVFSADDVLPEVIFIFKEISYGKLQVESMEIVMTEQMKLDADIANFDIPANFTEDYVVVTGTYGTTFTVTGITGDAATGNYLVWNGTTNTVEFTQPATDATGVITVEAVQGTLTEVSTDYNVVAKAPVVVTGTLMIYEIYGGGGNSGATYTNDYIVLYNGTGSDIDLTGYSVQYTSSTGTSWQVTELTGTIVAGEYYLIQEAAGSGGTVALPTPDATGTIYMSGTKGKVALVSSTTAITGGDPSTDANVIDYVGFGSADYYEGTAAAPAPSNTTSIQRTTLVDGDDNSTDFATVTPDLSYLN